MIGDFHSVLANRSGGADANYYRSFTSVDLTSLGIKQLLEQDTNEQLRLIREFGSRITAYFTYPLDAQIAVLDMVFNRGIGTVLNQGADFLVAVRNRNWKAAGLLSARVGTPAPVCQAEIKRLFDSAARVEPVFIDSKCARRPILQITP